MNKDHRLIITPQEWDNIANQRIKSASKIWNKLSVDERFWVVLNWLKQYQVVDPSKTGKQLFMSRPYWLTECLE